MARYSFHDISLDVQPDAIETRVRLAPFWSNLAFVSAADVSKECRHNISIFLHDAATCPPINRRALFEAEEFAAIEDGKEFYLSDGASLFRLRNEEARGDAYLDPSFFRKPELTQFNFWSFGLMKLLRSRGFYCLHSGGLITPDGCGLLVVGPSGSGKSTLTLGLIRKGWRYLTDDAVLLCPVSSRVAALSLREHFYIDVSDVSSNSDLPMGGVVADKSGGHRRRLRLQDSRFSVQRRRECLPQILLFSRIVDRPDSILSALNDGTALKLLLEASAPQLFDRQTMPLHLDLLRHLLKQSVSLELQAGADVYRDSGILIDLLRKVTGRLMCHESLLS